MIFKLSISSFFTTFFSEMFLPIDRHGGHFEWSALPHGLQAMWWCWWWFWGGSSFWIWSLGDFLVKWPGDVCIAWIVYHKHQPNVGKYTIHGSYGMDILEIQLNWNSEIYQDSQCEHVQSWFQYPLVNHFPRFKYKVGPVVFINGVISPISLGL